ncbi:MAG: IPT/TIG domain-containing protein [Bradymonadia bacterium]
MISPHRLRSLLTALGIVALSWAATGCEGGGGQRDLNRSVDEFDRGVPAPEPDARVIPDASMEDPDGPIVNSIIPARGPIDGGTRVRIVGQQFIEGTSVQIGGQACTDPVVESENHILCTTPPVEIAGSVSVFVRWPVGGAPSRAEDAFTYFEPLEVNSISPDRAPASGGIQVSIEGRGFLDPTQVRFGDAPALSVTVTDSNRIIAQAPPAEPGVYDVVVSNANGQLRMPEAFAYTEALSVQQIRPRWGFLAGGDTVTLQGSGLSLGSEVRFGGQQAVVLEGDPGRSRLIVETPAGAGVGPTSVSVTNINGEWAAEDAFFYVDGTAEGFTLEGVIPEQLPTFGGPFWVIGAGFGETTQVEVDGAQTPCLLEAPQVLACEAGPHPEGAATVSIVDGDRRVDRPGALTFYTQVQVFNVDPPRGAVSGGAVVQVVGAGFDDRITLTLDGQDMRVIEVIDDSTLRAVIPPGQPGAVDLIADNGTSSALLQEAFEYFNPTSRLGGIWGDTINGSVNFTLLDFYTGEPIEGATVIGEPFDELQGPPLSAFTDVQGQATLSQWGLRAPMRATGVAAGYEANTFDRITTENVTMYLRPFQLPEGGGGGPQEPILPGRVTGRVTGMADLEKPLDESLLLVAFVDTSHTAQGNRAFQAAPSPNGILFEDGEFDILTRPGELAVVVSAGYLSRSALRAYTDGLIDYWGMRGSFTPIALGFQRFLSLSPGEELAEIQIPVNIPCDVEVPITLLNPPGGEPGAPEVYTAQPYLNLGSEGFWQLDTGAEGRSPLMLVPYMPDAQAMDADIEVTWIADARPPARDEEGLPVSPYPYSVAFEDSEDWAAGVDIGPFVGTPVPLTPSEDNPLGFGRTFSWRFHDGVSGPIEPADATVVRIVNQGGRTLWTVVTPGPVTEITLPPLPEALGEVGLPEQGTLFLTIVPFLSEGRFDYEDFTYNELFGTFQTSYSVYSLTFNAGPEPEVIEQP